MVLQGKKTTKKTVTHPPPPLILLRLRGRSSFAAALPLFHIWYRCVLQKCKKTRVTLRMVRGFGCSV